MSHKLLKKLKSETDKLIAIYTSGNMAELEKAAHRYVKAYPEQGFGWKVLGVACQKQGKFKTAATAYGTALNLAPRDPDLHNNLGVVQKELGLLGEAEQSVRTALSLNHRNGTAHNNLGNILKSGGRIDAAIEAYRTALSLEPRLVMAHNNLGNALRELGRREEAVGSYRTALDIDPCHAEANLNLGTTLLELGRYEEALAQLSLLKKLNIGSVAVRNMLGNAIEGLCRPEEAEAIYRTALMDDPEHPGLQTNLGNTLVLQGRMPEALACYRAALHARPTMADPAVHLAMASLPVVTSSNDESLSVPTAFNDSLDELTAYAESAGWATLGRSIAVRLPFNLSYRPGNHRELLARYGDIAARARLAWLETEGEGVRMSTPPRRDRIRLGIVSAHVRRHSVWYVLLRGMLHHLDRSKFETIVYHTDSTVDSETEYARSLVDRLEQSPKNWLSLIREDSPDILFYPDLAMEPATFGLGLLRLAPLQVTTWGHPITSGLPEIDLYLSGEQLEGSGAGEHYRERLVLLPGTGACSCLMSCDMRPLDRSLVTLPDDRGITRFVVCQSVMKFDPAHDLLYADIAQQAGPCHFWIIRDVQIPWAAQIVEQRLEAAFRSRGIDPAGSITWLDWIPGDQFWAFLEEMDVYLDTPAFSGFTTAWQAVHCGLPVITLEGEFLRQRLAAGLLRRIGITETIARDAAEFVDKAVSLARDAAGREQLRQRLKEAAPRADDDAEVIRSMEDVLVRELGRKVSSREIRW